MYYNKYSIARIMTRITVIQVLHDEKLDYKPILVNNSNFLNSHQVEYIVWDNLEGYNALSIAKDLPSVRYIRKDFKDTKSSFLESAQLSQGGDILFLKSSDVLSHENLTELERERPSLNRSQLGKLEKFPWENFKFSDFNFLMKEKKTFLERVRMFFKY